MKDDLQKYLESYCYLQFWIKKQIIKNKEKVKSINPYSINSVNKKLM